MASAGEDSLFLNLTKAQSGTVLEAMLGVPRIDYAAEQILQSIASTRHQMVLDWFGQRIESASEKSSVDFDAVPFPFQNNARGVATAFTRYPRLHAPMARSYRRQWLMGCLEFPKPGLSELRGTFAEHAAFKWPKAQTLMT